MTELVLSSCFVSQDVLPDFTVLGMHSSCVRMCVLVCLCKEQVFFLCFLTLEELIQLLQECQLPYMCSHIKFIVCKHRFNCLGEYILDVYHST